MNDLKNQQMMIIGRYKLRETIESICKDIDETKKRIDNASNLEELEAIKNYMQMKLQTAELELRSVNIPKVENTKTV